MGIPLRQFNTRPPGIKLREVGAWATIAITSIVEEPWTDFKSGEPKLGNDGQPRTQDVVTGLFHAGTAAIHVDGADRLPNIDEPVAVYFAGHRRWSFVQAQRAKQTVEVGDLLHVCWATTERNATGNEKRIWEVGIEPNPDPATVAECERIHHNQPTPPPPSPHQPPAAPVAEPDPLRVPAAHHDAVAALRDRIRAAEPGVQAAMRDYCQSFQVSLRYPDQVTGEQLTRIAGRFDEVVDQLAGEVPF